MMWLLDVTYYKVKTKQTLLRNNIHHQGIHTGVTTVTSQDHTHIHTRRHIIEGTRTLIP